MKGLDYTALTVAIIGAVNWGLIGFFRLDLVALAESEADLGLLAGVQLLALVALLGVERDPLDVVLRQHGMLHGADLDMDDAVFHSPDRDVLLHGGVGGAGNDLAHRLTAADDGNARVLDLGNDVTAMLANVKLLLHDDSPFLSLIVFCVNFKIALGIMVYQRCCVYRDRSGSSGVVLNGR